MGAISKWLQIEKACHIPEMIAEDLGQKAHWLDHTDGCPVSTSFFPPRQWLQAPWFSAKGLSMDPSSAAMLS